MFVSRFGGYRSDKIAFVRLLFDEEEELDEELDEEEEVVDEGLRQGFLKLASIGAQVCF